jgi:hypothetical protein
MTAQMTRRGGAPVTCLPPVQDLERSCPATSFVDEMVGPVTAVAMEEGGQRMVLGNLRGQLLVVSVETAKITVAHSPFPGEQCAGLVEGG